ncbi:MAG TPA: hypothetical protein VKT54_00400 [Steroidobacteraceae bacterium]|nr:hypothetical protein [Steroidobacteraceae bacterium]
MSDELDPLLLRAFAQSERPLSDAEFVARIAAQMRPHAGIRGFMTAALRGLATGIAAPLRLRYAMLLAGTAAAVTLGSVLLSSL